jgi:Uma2 family endonuclease
MPHLKNAELINGVVYMAAAVRADKHGDPHADLLAWLGVYRANTPGVLVSDNASIRFDEDNMPQPDASVRLPAAAGGRATLAADGMLQGAPELVAEIAASSASYDMHDKLHVYRRHGVREYIVWRVLDAAIDWFVLREGRYEPLAPVARGKRRVLQSETLPGLWLDAQAMLAGDMARVLKVAGEGVAAKEHAAFVRRLGDAARR